MLVFYSLARSLAADLPVTRVLQCVSNVYAPQCTASTAANGGVVYTVRLSLSLFLVRARAYTATLGHNRRRIRLGIYQLRFLEAHSDNRVVMVVRDKGASRQTITDGSYVCQCA